MKASIFALCFVFGVGGVSAQKPVWQPSAGHRQVLIWPGAVPDARAVVKPESVETDTDPKELVAGKPWVYINNVSRPTMTVYSPTGKNTGAAVVVFPGGGYEELAIDLEGTEACDWLTAKGITCVLLKYRVPAPRSDPYWGRVSAVADCAGGRAEDGGAGALSCGGVARRSAQDWRDGLLGGWASGGGHQRPLRTHLCGCRCR